MTQKIEIEVDEEGKINTNSNFDLATTIVILEKVKTQLVDRTKISKKGKKEKDS